MIVYVLVQKHLGLPKEIHNNSSTRSILKELIVLKMVGLLKLGLSEYAQKNRFWVF